MSSVPRQHRVTAIVANIKQFRGGFYPRLAEALAREQVDFKVVYSSPSSSEARKRDSIVLPESVGLLVPRTYLAHDRALIQYLPARRVIQSDLIIAVFAAGYVTNYPLMLLSRLTSSKFAFWGHGYNHQGSSGSITEQVKRRLARSCDWWFAYTNQTAKYLVGLGMEADRITVVNNAIDTSEFSAQIASVTEEQLRAVRQQLQLDFDDEVALYCGSLYPEKKVPFLLQVANTLASRRPKFKLLIVGTGPDAALVHRACQSQPHLRYIGPAFGAARAAYFRLARVQLNPGLVGLGVLDAFAAGLPLITCNDSLHSPEIAYLVHGVNGLFANSDERQFAQTIDALLDDTELHRRLRLGALTSAGDYTLERMLQNVHDGILQCLSVPRRT